MNQLNELLAGEDVVHIAKSLLGATLETVIDSVKTSGIIVETEAYRAPDDKGSHAYGNKVTKRTETLFAPSGTVYVYLCYGIHHLFNLVSAPKGMAHAILVRAIEPIHGTDIMATRRNKKFVNYSLTNGPGKLTQALGIKTSMNGGQVNDPKGNILVNLPRSPLAKNEIISSPRVGIAYAKECAHWPWRFRIKGNLWTSLPQDVSYDLKA